MSDDGKVNLKGWGDDAQNILLHAYYICNVFILSIYYINKKVEDRREGDGKTGKQDTQLKGGWQRGRSGG